MRISHGPASPRCLRADHTMHKLWVPPPPWRCRTHAAFCEAVGNTSRQMQSHCSVCCPRSSRSVICSSKAGVSPSFISTVPIKHPWVCSVGCGADGGQEGSSSACWRAGWKHSAPQSRHCWCHCYTTALRLGGRIRRWWSRVWGERCLREAESWQRRHCKMSS